MESGAVVTCWYNKGRTSRGCDIASQPRKDNPMIETTNKGRLIISSTYWGSEYERAGKLFVSVSSGTVRVLVPRSNHTIIEECRPGKYAVLSRGPWPARGLADAVEILFEDGTDSPFVLHLSPESFKALPAKPPAGRNWRLALWCFEDDQPRQVLERLCYWRRVPKLPWLKPWEMIPST
jgi:hypothetical protein